MNAATHFLYVIRTSGLTHDVHLVYKALLPRGATMSISESLSEKLELQLRMSQEMLATLYRSGAAVADDAGKIIALHQAGFTAAEIAQHWPAIEAHFATLCMENAMRQNSQQEVA